MKIKFKDTRNGRRVWVSPRTPAESAQLRQLAHQLRIPFRNNFVDVFIRELLDEPTSIAAERAKRYPVRRAIHNLEYYDSKNYSTVEYLGAGPIPAHRGARW